MPQKIDELQLQIGSDASSAIREIGNLAGALDMAASSARKLAGAAGYLNAFGRGIDRIASADLTTAISNLKTLADIDLRNLKDKKFNVDVSVSGADRLDRLRYAASQADRDIGRSVTSMGKNLGKDLGMDTSGIAAVNDVLHDFTHDLANGGKNAESGIERLKDVIHNNARIATADLTGQRDAYVNFLKDVETLHIDPSSMSKDEYKEWKGLGLERLLKKGGQRIDTDVFGFGSGFVDNNSGIIDFFTLPDNAPDQYVFLRNKIIEAQEALSGFSQTDAVKEKVSQMAQATTDKLKEMMEVATSKHMTESADKIPLDLDIDQNRFETQIQKAINAATGKEYNTQPIKLKIDQQQLRNNVEAAFALVDIAKLPQYAQGFADVSNAISTMNQTNLKDTGITQFTNAMRRLVDTDTSKFDTTVLSKIVEAVTSLAKIGDVSKGLNRFVSSIARLANAGSKTQESADGLKKLIPELQNAVKTFQNIGTVEATINGFISSVASLASAGEKTGKTADNLGKLTTAVMDFLTAIQSAPEISNNLAMTIQGLGNLAAAGQNAGKAMESVKTSGSGGMVFGSIGKAASSTVAGLKKLLSISLQLGGKGASALGSFMTKLGLLPGHANVVDRTALSFTNLLRAILPFYGIGGIFNWAKGAVTAGSSIVELENVVDTAFGDLKKGYEDISGYVYRWAEGTIDAFGVSEIAAKQYAGRLMSMFNSSGFDVTQGMRDSAAKMSTDLIERAGDIASFYDITVEEAMTKVQAGLAGMNRPLRSIGVNMTVANLEAFALSKGLNQSWQEMDQATQMALRYEYILNATQYAMGDFSRTSGTYANQIRLLALNFQMLGATIGQGLISAIAPAISWINALIRKLIVAANVFRTFMYTLFGKAIGASKGVSDEMAAYLDDAAGSASDLGDSAGGASDGLGSAGKAAKDLKKQLTVLPFDELNQLAKDTETAGSGGSGGGAGGGGVGGGIGDLGLSDLSDIDIDSSPTIEAINRWAARMREAFQKHQWKKLGRIVAEGINSGFKYIYDVLDWQKIKPKVVDGFITPFQETFNSMMNWIDWSLIGQTFARGLNDVVYTLRAWITGFEWRKYGTYIGEGMNSMVNGVDADALGRLIADKFKMAWDFFGGWVETFNFASLGGKLKIGFTSFLDELDSVDMGETLANFLNGISTTIINFLEDGTVRDGLADEFSGFVNGFLGEFDEEDAAYALRLFGDTITGALKKAFGDIDKSELVGKLKEVLGGLDWGLIGTAIAINASGKMAVSLFGAMFKTAAKEAITNSLAGMTLKDLALAGLTITAAALAVGAVTIGGIEVGKWIDNKLRGMFPWYGGAADSQKNAKSAGATGGSTSYSSFWSNFGDWHPAGTTTQDINNSQAGVTPTASASTSGRTEVVTLAGFKDPSFTDLELAKAALIENPIVRKLLTGETTKSFDEGYLKLTDTKPYQAVKKFGANVTKQMEIWYENLKDTKAYQAIKKFGANPTDLIKTWYKNLKDQGSYQANKKFGANPTDKMKEWWSHLIDRGSYQANKKFGADPTNDMKTWWSHLIDTGHYLAVKWFKGKDQGNFTNYVDSWKNLHDKFIDIKFNIITTAKRVVAGLIDGTKQFLASIWTENARGGLFTKATGFQVFGEAGAEAAIPLERKSTLKRIGSAIADAGGTSYSGSNAELAAEIARQLAPIIMSAMDNQNQRPMNVNAVLYTENNEVLARAVNQGNRSLDKRYRPVSQYNY